MDSESKEILRQHDQDISELKAGQARMESKVSNIDHNMSIVIKALSDIRESNKTNWPTIFTGAAVLVAILGFRGNAYMTSYDRDLARLEKVNDKLTEQFLEIYKK